MDLTAMSYQQFFPYVVALIVTVLLVAIGFLTYSLVKVRRDKQHHDNQLNELIGEYDEEEISAESKVTLLGRWNAYWGKTMREGGIKRYQDSDERAGTEVGLFAITIGIIVSVVFQNPIIGPAVAALALFLMSSRLKAVYRKNSEKIGIQLPGMLFALKANLQAAETSERAMLKVVDTMPSPLYEDLVVMRNRLLAGDAFRDALIELSAYTNSRELKFLCACMIQATNSGSSIQSQIDNILNVLKARQKINDEISRANKSISPATMLASFMIPGLFLFSYFIDSAARDFWFIDPISWIVLLVVGGLYAMGMGIVKKMVNKVKNM
jgi:Flp pilus assembly protein TadB